MKYKLTLKLGLFRLLAFVFCALGAAVGTLLCLGGVLLFLSAQHAGSWPTVTGQIIRSSLKISGSGSGAKYTPDIAYQYTVDGTAYTGSHIKVVHISSTDRPEMNTFVQRYPVGKTVQVHYEPGQPQRCCLEAGLSSTAIEGFTVIIVATLLFAGAAIWALNIRFVRVPDPAIARGRTAALGAPPAADPAQAPDTSQASTAPPPTEDPSNPYAW